MMGSENGIKGKFGGCDAGVVVAVLDFGFFGHADGLFPVGGSFFGGWSQTVLILMHDDGCSVQNCGS